MTATKLTIDNDPYSKFDAWTDEGPVVWTDHFNAWIVSGWPEIMQVVDDLESFSVEHGYRDSKGDSWKKIEGKGTDEVSKRWLRYMDPPELTPFRHAHDSAVPYKEAQPEHQPPEMRDRFRKIVVDKLEASRGKKRVEAMQEWCIPIPCLGTMDVLGLPPEDFPKLYDWVVNGTLMAFRFPFDHDFWSDENAERSNAAADNLLAYLTDLFAHHKTNPGNNFMSGLLAHANEFKQFTEHELVQMVINHINGGFHESAFQTLGDGIFQLLLTGQYQQVVDDPSKASAATEEIMRYHPAAPLGARRAVRDVALGGKNIKSGDFVFVSFGGAQRDPKNYKNARVFDINREGGRNGDWTFGFGPHRCTGRDQVKLMTTLFFEELVQRYPNLKVEEWPANLYMTLRYQPRQDVVLLESLPLTLG